MENLHPNNANANDSIDVMRKKTCFDSSEKLERIGFGKVSQPLVQALYSTKSLTMWRSRKSLQLPKI